jgi:hypothetical protein
MNRIEGLEKSQAPWHLRSRLNRIFDVSSDELYEPQPASDI